MKHIIDESLCLKSAINLMHTHPHGFFVADLFREMYRGESPYHDPSASKSPTGKYGKLVRYVYDHDMFVQVSKKWVLKNYKVIPANKPTPNLKKEPAKNPNTEHCHTRKPGWIRRFLHWCW